MIPSYLSSRFQLKLELLGEPVKTPHRVLKMIFSQMVCESMFETYRFCPLQKSAMEFLVENLASLYSLYR